MAFLQEARRDDLAKAARQVGVKVDGNETKTVLIDLILACIEGNKYVDLEDVWYRLKYVVEDREKLEREESHRKRKAKEEQERQKEKREKEFELERLRISSQSSRDSSPVLGRRLKRSIRDLMPPFERSSLNTHLLLFRKMAKHIDLDPAFWAAEFRAVIPKRIDNVIKRVPIQLRNDFHYIERVLRDHFHLNTEVKPSKEALNRRKKVREDGDEVTAMEKSEDAGEHTKTEVNNEQHWENTPVKSEASCEPVEHQEIVQVMNNQPEIKGQPDKVLASEEDGGPLQNIVPEVGPAENQCNTGKDGRKWTLHPEEKGQEVDSAIENEKLSDLQTKVKSSVLQAQVFPGEVQERPVESKPSRDAHTEDDWIGQKGDETDALPPKPGTAPPLKQVSPDGCLIDETTKGPPEEVDTSSDLWTTHIGKVSGTSPNYQASTLVSADPPLNTIKIIKQPEGMETLRKSQFTCENGIQDAECILPHAQWVPDGTSEGKDIEEEPDSGSGIDLPHPETTSLKNINSDVNVIVEGTENPPYEVDSSPDLWDAKKRRNFHPGEMFPEVPTRHRVDELVEKHKLFPPQRPEAGQQSNSDRPAVLFHLLHIKLVKEHPPSGISWVHSLSNISAEKIPITWLMQKVRRPQPLCALGSEFKDKLGGRNTLKKQATASPGLKLF